MSNMENSRDLPSSLPSSLPPAGTGDLKGPTETSNWVIPGRLLTGAYPGEYTPEETAANLKALLKAGVTLIVPLVEPFLFEYIPYVSQAKEIAKKEFRRELNFEFYPISDLTAGDEESLLQFIPNLADRIKHGKDVIYIHCFSGHGRSGLVISLLLSSLYGIADGKECLRLTNYCHSKREYDSRRSSPETSGQCRQVKSLAQRLSKNKE